MSDHCPSTNIGELRRRNQILAEKLLALTSDVPSSGVPVETPPPPQGADAIVAHIEINDHHGVGALLRRLYGHTENVISIRSKDYYGGQQDFGAMHVRISHGDASRDMVAWNVLQGLAGATVKSVLCVPYFPDDARTAIALKEIFGAPLCTFLMDDQNLYADGIPDAIMAQLLDKSSLRLAISPQMCTAYQAKFGHRIWLMPPLAPSRLLLGRTNHVPPEALGERQPLILGNIWGQHWVDSLRKTIRGTDVRLRWYNNGQFPWLACSKEDLIRDGIVPQEGPPDPDDTFVEVLRQAPFVVLPSGTLEENDDRRFIAQLSFPSRIPYILATSHTPILVLGSPNTAAAQIVRHFGIGITAPYEQAAFAEAVKHITRPEVNLSMRRAAFRLSIRFADLGAAEWISQSLAKGEPIDSRYEDLLPYSPADATAGRPNIG